MISGPPFPVGPGELTVEFLSTALGSVVSNFGSTPIGETKGMFGTLALLDIEYAESDRSGPSRLVAKFSAGRPEALASARRGRTHERELRFYDELSPRTPSRVPAIHGSWYNPDTAEFLILQDYIDGDQSVDQLTGLTVDQARLVLTEMARLHATWWRSPELAELDWLPGIAVRQRRGNLSLLADLGWPMLAELLDDLSPAEVAFGAKLGQKIDMMVSTLDALPSTLVHSDLRVDNILFDSTDGQVVLLDWQGVCAGPAALDLAYFLSQSLEPDLRRQVEPELVDHYRAELDRSLRANEGSDSSNPLDGDDPLAGYDEALIYGLIIASAIPIIADPDEPRAPKLARSMATRALAALADRGMLDG